VACRMYWRAGCGSTGNVRVLGNASGCVCVCVCVCVERICTFGQVNANWPVPRPRTGGRAWSSVNMQFLITTASQASYHVEICSSREGVGAGQVAGVEEVLGTDPGRALLISHEARCLKSSPEAGLSRVRTHRGRVSHLAECEAADSGPP